MQQRLSKDGASLAVLIGAAALSADNTPAGVDIRGFQEIEIDLAIGIGGITFSGTDKIEFKLTAAEYTDGVLGAYAAVATGDVFLNGAQVTVGTGGIIKSLEAAHAAAAVYRFEYKGNAGSLKLLADFSGTHGAATPIAALVRKSHGRNAPAI